MSNPCKLFALLISWFAIAAWCGRASAQTDTLKLVAMNSEVIARQDSIPVTDPLTVTQNAGNTAQVRLSHATLPSGIRASFTQPRTGDPPSGHIYRICQRPPRATTPSASAPPKERSPPPPSTITVAVAFEVHNAIDTDSGISGHLQQIMSTNVGPVAGSNSYWDGRNTPPYTPDLEALEPQHIRILPALDSGAIPWVTQSSSGETMSPTQTCHFDNSVVGDLSFAALNQTMTPILTIYDESPMFDIKTAPAFLNDADGNFIFNDVNLKLLSTYAQVLVCYYNKVGVYWGPSGLHTLYASTAVIRSHGGAS